MKKKIFTGVVTAMMLVFTMGTTVFADPSPTSDTALIQRTNELNDATTVEGSGYNANNELITVSSKGVDKEVYREGNRQANAVASAQNGSATVMAMSDISVPSATNTSKGIKVTICASGIKAGDNVYVLHKLKSGSWQTVKPDSVSNGKVTVTLYSFSPVMVVKYSSNVNPAVTTDPSKDENSQGSNTNSNVNDNSNSSSQTNNNNQSQTNNNNQNNSQTNNQYNPVSVNQNVTVNYPQSYDDGEDSFEDDYDDGYTDGYTDGKNSVRNSSTKSSSARVNGKSGAGSQKGTSASGSVSYKTSPKTGAALPALPFVAVFAAAGIVVCGRKARKN